jgi:L-2-hydroxycarboxylate dehydrogenase (NAD+)
MKLKIDKLKTEILEYLQIIGFNLHDRTTLTQLVIEQEIVGNQFSALENLTKDEFITRGANTSKETIATKKPALQLIKGNGRLAPLITADHLDEIVRNAKTQGIYALGIFDSSYNDFFDIFCRRIVAKNCIALIVENGGPQGVVPYGGISSITGTNPIAYGVPTHNHPIIFDAATAMYAWGRIDQARELKTKLPDNSYLDKTGKVTIDPERAVAILPFGGYKGFAINLLIDILSGILVRGKSGLDQPMDTQKYIGTLIIVIDPSAFGDLKQFKDSTSKLVNDITNIPATNKKNPVRVPGIRGSKRLAQYQIDKTIKIEGRVWEKFQTKLTKLRKTSELK